MQFLKIIIGLTILMLAFLGLTSSKVSSNTLEANVSTPTEIKIVDEKARLAYKVYQQKLHTALQQYFDQAIASGDIVGAGVSIVRGDSIVISEGFGKRSIKGTAKVDGETVFRLGSLSKGFAGVLAANLKAEGKLSWNDKITDYIPQFQLGDKANTAKIRLGHILSHTSGTPYHSFTNLVEAGLSMETIAARFNEVKPISKPGHQYSYQNAMFSLSQEVMRKATGKDTKTLLSERFFKPLGMTSVSMNHKDLITTENIAMPHSRRRSGWRTLPLRDRYYNAVAAGGINANAEDMAKWMRFLLGHNPEVMQEDALQEVFNPFVAVSYNNKYYQRWPGHKQSHYGFGWRIHNYQESDNTEEKTMWHHGGSVNNYRNEIALFPDTDTGICVLLNGNSRLARNVIPDLYHLLKELDKK
ncbi:serine hydrolase domain-containing protein [Maribacter sp. 2308TA10-17]|uniref:serine hydrolase domain-containing protein n=1 Tax=Maribacter sp. 2308TA10-17 TaxID=3386276 RepID=UPI0039BD83FA